MKSPTLPKATPNLTEQDARKALIQLKSVFLEQNKPDEGKIRRVRELLDRHKSRRREMAECHTAIDANPDQLATVVTTIKTASEQMWEDVKGFCDAANAIRELEVHDKPTTAEAVAVAEAVLEKIRAANPDQIILSLRSADNWDESPIMAAWIKTMNLGKKKEKTTREVEESGPEA